MTQPLAIIVGAGIAGLSAAWWLDKAGWRAIIIERAPAIRPGGYIVTISGFGFQSLKRMHLLSELESVSYRIKENVIRDRYGRELVRAQYSEIHGTTTEAFSVCRGDLARTLADALPTTASIRFGETMQEVIDQGESVKVTLGNGDVIQADFLIGADGIRSEIRRQFWKDIDCFESLGYAYAAYDIELEDEYRSCCDSYNSPGRLDILYAANNIRLAVLHIWRQDQPIFKSRQNKFEIVRQIPAKMNVEVIQKVIDRADADGATPVVDHLNIVHLPHWSRGRIMLLGDAAHCLTLMSGQGAGMAIASAEILGLELARTANNIPQALENHEKKLRPIIQRLQQYSRRMAAAYIPKTIFSYYLRNLMFKILPHSWIVKWHATSLRAEIDLTVDMSGQDGT